MLKTLRDAAVYVTELPQADQARAGMAGGGRSPVADRRAWRRSLARTCVMQTLHRVTCGRFQNNVTYHAGAVLTRPKGLSSHPPRSSDK
jgi:hypothetical protein